MRRFARLVLLFCAVSVGLLLTGCGTVMNHTGAHGHITEIPQGSAYGGTRLLARGAVEFVKLKRSEEDSEFSSVEDVLLPLLYAADFPLTVAADTLALPWSFTVPP